MQHLIRVGVQLIFAGDLVALGRGRVGVAKPAAAAPGRVGVGSGLIGLSAGCRGASRGLGGVSRPGRRPDKKDPSSELGPVVRGERIALDPRREARTERLTRRPNLCQRMFIDYRTRSILRMGLSCMYRFPTSSK